MAVEALSYIRYGCNQEFFVTLFQLSFILECEALVDGSLANVYIINVGIPPIVIIYDGEYVHIVNCVTDDFALRNKVIEE